MIPIDKWHQSNPNSPTLNKILESNLLSHKEQILRTQRKLSSSSSYGCQEIYFNKLTGSININSVERWLLKRRRKKTLNGLPTERDGRHIVNWTIVWSNKKKEEIAICLEPIMRSKDTTWKNRKYYSPCLKSSKTEENHLILNLAIAKAQTDKEEWK